MIDKIRLSLWPRLFPLLFSLVFLLFSIKSNDEILAYVALFFGILGVLLLSLPLNYLVSDDVGFYVKLPGIKKFSVPFDLIESYSIKQEMSYKDGISHDVVFVVSFKEGVSFKCPDYYDTMLTYDSADSGSKLTVSMPFGDVTYSNRRGSSP